MASEIFVMIFIGILIFTILYFIFRERQQSNQEMEDLGQVEDLKERQRSLTHELHKKHKEKP